MVKEPGKKSWKKAFNPFFLFYESDLPNPKAMEAEMDLWEKFWLSSNQAIPNNVKSALKSVPYPGFENIKECFKILGTLPVTSCECERSFSALRILKDYTRSTMGEERLNGLALMHIHHDTIPDVNKVIDKFSMSGNRRLELML